MMKARKSNETRDEYFRAVLQNKGIIAISSFGAKEKELGLVAICECIKSFGRECVLLPGTTHGKSFYCTY